MRREGTLTRLATAALAITTLALTVAGCGSATLTARALRTQASIVCTRAIRRSESIAPPRANTAGGVFLAKGIAIFGPELSALRRLAPPHALADAYRTALAAAKQQLDALIATEHNLRGGDDPVVAIKQLDVELTPVDARDLEAWRAVGVPDCANLSRLRRSRSGR